MPLSSTGPSSPLPPRKAGGTSRPRSVRWHLALLIAAAALPLTVLLAYQIVRDARTDLEAARALVRGLAEVTANDTANVLRTIKRTTRQLAERPLVAALDRTRCDPVLVELRRFELNYSNVVTFDAQGNAVCSAVQSAGATPRNVANLAWFARLRESDGPVIGAPQRGIYTGRWISIVAQALREPDGRLRGAVAVAIDLAAFQPVARAALPAGGVMGIVTGDGVIVARSSRAEESIGRNVSDTNVGRALMSGAANSGLIVGNDQIERLYAYMPIAESGWFVTAGVPADLVHGRLRQSLMRNGLGALAALVVALLMVALTYRRLAAPLLALHDTVRGIAEGDRQRRVPVGGPRELAEVGSTFNHMMDRIPRIEQALVDSEERYRQLFLASPDAILVVRDERVAMANPAAALLFGCAAGDALVGRALRELVHADDRAVVGERAAAALRTHAPDGLEIGVLRPGGERVIADARLLPFHYAGAAAVLCILRDISTRKRLEGELAEHRTEAERMVNELVAKQTAAAIAHELNQPLVAVSAYSEAALAMVRGGAPRTERLAQALEGAAGQAQRAGRTLHELLGILHGGDAGAEMVDVNDAIRETVADSLATSPTRFSPVLELADDLPRVFGNRVQLQRVLANLLQNAIDAMRAAGVAPGGRRVVLATACVAGAVEVSVRDSGPGPDAGTAGRLFEPFFTTKARGIGLGLTISRALIESHGGRLWHDPAGAAGGTFRFTLPAAP